MMTLLSLYIFSHVHVNNRPIDVMILEVGIGGRYDPTNVFDHISTNTICGVTTIDYDHIHVLGNTLEEISFEKGGIFRRLKDLELAGSVQADNVVKLYNKTSIPTCFTIESNPRNVLNVLQKCASTEGYTLE